MYLTSRRLYILTTIHGSPSQTRLVVPPTAVAMPKTLYELADPLGHWPLSIITILNCLYLLVPVLSVFVVDSVAAARKLNMLFQGTSAERAFQCHSVRVLRASHHLWQLPQLPHGFADVRPKAMQLLQHSC